MSMFCILAGHIWVMGPLFIAPSRSCSQVVVLGAIVAPAAIRSTMAISN